ncbi:MAG: hypothetical protein QOH56_2149 [Pseudonocardiales bacterium]|nr:hypothetical protein [Frankiales bacterium]MDQ1691313.1 hypothetical protein [Pseudonocardiales bacterium]MDQ1717518.1 hypothetical protein [Pseudonocardiales bacterium]MDQ1735898.1 hypothetical protein [Pseudonocardiales bacterium]MDQ1749098.1 hypothetical protein [Pseudonocardiales bacterium]
MSTTPGTGDSTTAVVDRLGIESGMVVQELGYDDDVDHDLRDAIENRLDDDMVDEDSDDVVDVVLLWFREYDGDLVDALVDAIAPLADTGVIWLLTPKRGRDGYVEPSDISEAAPTAGLSQTSLLPVGTAWTGARLAPRRAKSGADKVRKVEK